MNGHVTKRQSKHGPRWHVVYYVDKAHGGPARKSGGTYAREKDAKAALGDILKAYRDGSYREPSALTVAALIDRWLRDCVAVDRKPNTVRHRLLRSACARLGIIWTPKRLVAAVTVSAGLSTQRTTCLLRVVPR